MAVHLRETLGGLLLGWALSGGAVQADLRLLDAWIQEPPPGSRILAGYLTLENTGPESRFLVAVSSPLFSRAELHRTVITDDIARMEAQSRLEIPAGARLTLEPGSHHLMLFDPSAQLETGMQVDITLEFDDQSALTSAVEVRRFGDADGHAHRHH
jgi:periplasmic copper chaperone A